MRRRFEADADTTTKQFKDWVEKARANNYWLVLVYHPVEDDDRGVNPYGTSKTRFAEQMQAIKDAGIDVKTMRDALNEVMPQTGQDWAKLPSPRTFRSIRVRSPARSRSEPEPAVRSRRRPAPTSEPRPRPPHRRAQTATKDTVRPTIGSAPRRAARIAAAARCGRASSALDNLQVVKCKGTVRKGARIDTPHARTQEVQGRRDRSRRQLQVGVDHLPRAVGRPVGGPASAGPPAAVSQAL